MAALSSRLGRKSAPWYDLERAEPSQRPPRLPPAQLGSVFLISGQLDASGVVVPDGLNLAKGLGLRCEPLNMVRGMTMAGLRADLEGYYHRCLKANTTPVVVYAGHGAAAPLSNGRMSTNTFAFAPLHNGEQWLMLDFMRFSEQFLCRDGVERALILVLLTCNSIGAQFQAEYRNRLNTPLKVFVKYTGCELARMTSAVLFSESGQDRYFMYRPADLAAYTGATLRSYLDYFSTFPDDLLSYQRVFIDTPPPPPPPQSQSRGSVDSASAPSKRSSGDSIATTVASTASPRSAASLLPGPSSASTSPDSTVSSSLLSCCGSMRRRSSNESTGSC